MVDRSSCERYNCKSYLQQKSYAKARHIVDILRLALEAGELPSRIVSVTRAAACSSVSHILVLILYTTLLRF